MDMATSNELGLVWMGSNDMLLQADSEHIFPQQNDGTYYNDTSQSLQSLEDMRPQLGMENFIGLDEYDPYCGEDGSKVMSPSQTPQQSGTKKIRPVKHPGLKLKTPIAYQSDTDPSVIPIQKDGMAVCQNCGAIGVKHAFYTKERRFCSLACSRGENPTPIKDNNEIKQETANNQVQQIVQPTMQQQVQHVQPVQMQQLAMQQQMQMQQQQSMQVLMPQQMQAQIQAQLPPQLQSQLQQMQPIQTQMMGNGLQPQVPMQMQPIAAQMQQLPMGIPQMDQLQMPVQPMQMQSQVDMSHMQLNMPLSAQMQVMQATMEVVPQMPMQCETIQTHQEEDRQVDQKQWISSDSKSEDSLSSNATTRPYSAFTPLPPLQLDEPIFPPDKKSCPDLAGTFEWDSMLNDPGFSAAPVSCFQHAPMADSWDNITVGMKVEVQNTDCDNFSEDFPDSFWVATVLKIQGYKALLRYEGFGQNSSKDFWVNLCSSIVHHVGWCAIRGRPLIPPKTVEHKYSDWKDFLVKRLTGARTLPSTFYNKVHDSLKSRFRCDLNVEVVDKNRISQVKVATIEKIVGKRLHVRYYETDDDDNGFWCHEDSNLIHPVGWAQRVGHQIDAPPEYVERCAIGQWDEDDATDNMFPLQVRQQQQFNQIAVQLATQKQSGFVEGMKLEAIDPLNLSSICVATVMKVLNEGYLMIRIETYDADVNCSDWFCYHQTSACIFAPGFCEANNITLTPPKGYEVGTFNWNAYLQETQSVAAPSFLFKQWEVPNHGFVEDMHLEATDIMDPRLVCVATISRVVGRLLRVHFDGWEVEYDQWLDCSSSDLYPVGWCQLVSHKLEGPRVVSPPKVNPNTGRTQRGVRGRRGRRGMPKRRPGMKKSPGGTLLSTHVPAMGDAAVPMLMQVDSFSDTGSDQGLSHEGFSELPTEAEGSHHQFDVGVTAKVIPRLIDNSSSLLGELNPNEWDVNDVSHFLKVNDCAAYCDNFARKSINGKALLNLTKEEVMALSGMKVGPSLKISDLIQQLRIKVNPAQERAKAGYKKLL
ncbi:hypothetical protein FOCC_FOCC000753 [Frankliniella occidentalis]|uniref:MBT domain-containing protein 1 isoform X2 n=1 Tax=Frankliniella occidentalis TaxID=133901 RepID=A0A6J1S722_FRAOC|nr:MBT domain-containing protein 1 isoform X2 [Frankliniella occidentalis]KAE8752631.1 hypothetical protein FOCC_FOCC000753 [Frankliniella occidentalis]